jgi:prepilin-type N-terminal cleavage/methylation domain-containing protein
VKNDRLFTCLTPTKQVDVCSLRKISMFTLTINEAAAGEPVANPSGRRISLLVAMGISTFQPSREICMKFFPRNILRYCLCKRARQFAVIAFDGSKHRGFSLTELLIVIAITVFMIGLTGPAIQMMQKGRSLGQTASAIVGFLEESRAYAMTNNTYVYVGFAEVMANQSESAQPQAPGVGRVAIAAVASRDGTQVLATASSDPANADSNYNNGTSLIAIAKLERSENLHLASLMPALTGPMARPQVDPALQLGSPDFSASGMSFSWPLGKSLSGGQYKFDKVIVFDPQGAARATAGDSVPGWLEIGLQKTYGATVPSLPQAGMGNQVALQVDGMTGVIRYYQP